MAAPSIPPAAPVDRAVLFRALSDETRLAILDLLQGGERCVCDLQEALRAAQSRLSFHLRVLREAGLVEDRKDGRWSYYRLRPARFEEAAALVASFALPASLRTRAGQTLHRLGRARPPQAARRAGVAGPAREGSDGCCG